MRWNMVFGALVVSVGLCSQSFGFELLDRMLGLNDCGCNSCCQKSCQPACGCDKGCEPSCCAAAAPSCAAEPSCCAAPSCCRSRCHSHCCGLLDGLHNRLFGCGSCNKCGCNKGCGCEAAAPSCAAAAAPSCAAAEPSCGCNAPCNSCGRSRCHKSCGGCNKCNSCGHHGLLDIFRCGCHKSCGGCNSCQQACGCGGGDGGQATTPTGSDDAAPMPPAPTADPSASIQSKRRMVSASSKIVRRN